MTIHRFAAAVVVLAAPLAAIAAEITPAEAVRRAKQVVTRDFHDPRSAQWENVYFNRLPDGSHAICGRVNGKNRLGGYVGFRPFIAFVSLKKDPAEAALEDAERMAKNAQTNLANVGSGLPSASDVLMDSADGSRAFFDAFVKYCAEGKRTYVK